MKEETTYGGSMDINIGRMLSLRNDFVFHDTFQFLLHTIADDVKKETT